MRQLVVTFVKSIVNDLHLHLDTLFLTINIWDSVAFQYRGETLKRMKLVAATSLLIAAKVEEVYLTPTV
jgi:hypothetical protein